MIDRPALTLAHPAMVSAGDITATRESARNFAPLQPGDTLIVTGIDRLAGG